VSRPGFAPRLDRTFDPSPRAPFEARRAVEELAAELDLAHSQDLALLRDTQLLVSELVTNSVRHSGSASPIRLRAWVRDRGVRLEIADGGFGFEADSPGGASEAESGRGLLILEALTDRWGISRDGQTRVWFELSRPRGSAVSRQTA